GRVPFQGPAHALPAQVVEDSPPRPRTLNPDLPPDLEAICLKAMAKRPVDRYATAAAFAADLRAFLRGEPVVARPLTWFVRLRTNLRRRHRDTVMHDWTPLLLLEGLTILAGCALVNAWELTVPPRIQWLPMLLTKLVQVVVMLVIAVRCRPVKQVGM